MAIDLNQSYFDPPVEHPKYQADEVLSPILNLVAGDDRKHRDLVTISDCGATGVLAIKGDKKPSVLWKRCKVYELDENGVWHVYDEEQAR